jgi:hypothetical protein
LEKNLLDKGKQVHEFVMGAAYCLDPKEISFQGNDESKKVTYLTMKISPCDEKSRASRLKKGEKCYSNALIKQKFNSDPWSVGIITADSYIDYGNYTNPLTTAI